MLYKSKILKIVGTWCQPMIPHLHLRQPRLCRSGDAEIFNFRLIHYHSFAKNSICLVWVWTCNLLLRQALAELSQLSTLWNLRNTFNLAVSVYSNNAWMMLKHDKNKKVFSSHRQIAWLHDVLTMFWRSPCIICIADNFPALSNKAAFVRALWLNDAVGASWGSVEDIQVLRFSCPPVATSLECQSRLQPLVCHLQAWFANPQN